MFSSHKWRATAAALVAPLLVAPLLMSMGAATPAHAEPAETNRPNGHRNQLRAIGSSPASPVVETALQPDGRVGKAAAIDPALADLNAARSRVGVGAVITDAATQSATQAHANYLLLNQADPNLDIYTEVAGKPGYTAAGAAIAPYVAVATSEPSARSAFALLLQDPWERDGRLLNGVFGKAAVARTGEWTVFGFAPTSNNRPAPTVFPAGPLVNASAFTVSSSTAYTAQCGFANYSAGFPITAFYGAPHDLASASVELFGDGVRVDTCVMAGSDKTGMASQVVVVPRAPLSAGVHYSGTITGTTTSGQKLASLPINFSTYAAAKGKGDQTSDGIADLLTVSTAGDLYLYKGVKPGSFGYGWKIGHGWSGMRWIGHTPDLNGDGFDDLLAVRSDGKMYLYYGRGMGSYSSAILVGHGWQGVTNITVVGDMDGNGTQEVVAVAGNGALWRYNLTRNGFSGQTQIGQNWQGLTHTTSVGDFNGDGTADILGVTAKGELIAYWSKGGFIKGQSVVGRGWGGWTALVSPGDLTGDGKADLIGRNAEGTLYSYARQQGSFGAARVAGTGWGGMRLFG